MKAMRACRMAEGMINDAGANDAMALGVKKVEISVKSSSDGNVPSVAARAIRNVRLSPSLLLGNVPFLVASAVNTGAKNYDSMMDNLGVMQQWE